MTVIDVYRLSHFEASFTSRLFWLPCLGDYMGKGSQYNVRRVALAYQHRPLT